MKLLQNRSTGEIGCPEKITVVQYIDGKHGSKVWYYGSLAELNEEWEDYEEPKGSALDLMILTLTNFIENEPDEDKVDLEDCEQMLEKLKAWKRLKGKGFRFDGYDVAHNSNGDLCGQLFYNAGNYCIGDVEKDLDLLFGDEE